MSLHEAMQAAVLLLRLFSFRHSVLNIHRWNNFTSSICFIILWLTVVLCVCMCVGVEGSKEARDERDWWWEGWSIFRARWRYMGFIGYMVLYSQCSVFAGSASLDSTNHRLKELKFQRQNMNLPCVGTYLYIAFTLYSVLKLIQRLFKVYKRMCVGYAKILHCFIKQTWASSDFDLWSVLKSFPRYHGTVMLLHMFEIFHRKKSC